MNVNPVTAPGPSPSRQTEARVKAPQAPAPAVDRGQVLQREDASAGRLPANSAQAVANSPTKAAEADRQKADQLRSFVANDKFSISTYHDEGSGRQIVEVRDQDTGDVVSQYPSEELRRLYESLRETLVDQQA
jgi:uncharacterized FlaG/YvyC family protein